MCEYVDKQAQTLHWFLKPVIKIKNVENVPLAAQRLRRKLNYSICEIINLLLLQLNGVIQSLT